jgi:hypothetical protein
VESNQTLAFQQVAGHALIVSKAIIFRQWHPSMANVISSDAQ